MLHQEAWHDGGLFSQCPHPKALPQCITILPPLPYPINQWYFVAPKGWWFHGSLNEKYSAPRTRGLAPVGSKEGYKRGIEEREDSEKKKKKRIFYQLRHQLTWTGSWSKEGERQVEHIVWTCLRIPEQMPPDSPNKAEKHLNPYFLWTLHGLEEMIQIWSKWLCIPLDSIYNGSNRVLTCLNWNYIFQISFSIWFYVRLT